MNIKDNITYIGVLDSHEKKHLLKHCHNNQEVICENLEIPCQKPDIENPLMVMIESKVINCKNVKTLLAKKIIMHVMISVNLMYTANNEVQSVHSAHFAIPHCAMIILSSYDDIDCFNDEFNYDSYSFIEFASVTKLTERKISLTLILLDAIKDREEDYYHKSPVNQIPKTSPSDLLWKKEVL